MKLIPIITAADEGTTCYEVECFGKRYPVNPGQERILINGVNFPIATEGYKIDQRKVREEAIQEEAIASAALTDGGDGESVSIKKRKK